MRRGPSPTSAWTAEPVVERIVTRSEAAAIGLDSPSSGDLIAFLEPGYAFGRSTTEDVISPSRYYGQHGYLASHDALCGMLFARGGGIRPRRVEEMQGIQVAPLVKEWLGLSQQLGPNQRQRPRQ